MTPRSIIQVLASAIVARQNCMKSGNTEWKARHEDTIATIARDWLPRGSGIDAGTLVDLEVSRADRIVLHTSFHHMDEGGGYDGWTSHTIVIRPAFDGIDLDIKGRDRNGIKEYLHDTFYWQLTQIAPDEMQPARRTHAEADRMGGTT